MIYPEAKILLFAKAPNPGTVKTRLIADIGEHAATELHKELVLNALNTLTEAALSPVELWCAPDTEHPFFIECQKQFAITLRQQQGEGLGERMHYALSQHRGAPTLLIGSDIPLLNRNYLHQGLRALLQGQSWVIGPAEDGGYVLIGCYESDERLFDGVAWGGSQVLAQTMKNAAHCGVAPLLLETLWDLDNIADLARWRCF
ncbi:hypothetical protein MNBD_GAMMA18-1221 [hydrothermal vent metagenome]|uniref:Glycosyltransferase n=1 Tax=hydrothermal vent metagenome TaxID=652676 RepID=A0A3B0ZAV6_9ZZZZ